MLTAVHFRFFFRHLHITYLSVSILNANIHCDHEEDGNRDSKISNQATNLEGKLKHSPPSNPGHYVEVSFRVCSEFLLTGPGRKVPFLN